MKDKKILRYCKRGKRLYPFEVGEVCPTCGGQLMNREFSPIMTEAIMTLIDLGYDVRNARGGYEEQSYLEKIMTTNISISHSKTFLNWWMEPSNIDSKSVVLCSISVSCINLNPLGNISSSIESMEKLLLNVVSILPQNKDEDRRTHYGPTTAGEISEYNKKLSGNDGSYQSSDEKRVSSS